MSFWEENDRQSAALGSNSLNILQRTGASIQRSNLIAYETEQLGAEVLNELGEQRESLLRTTARLEGADEDLSRSRIILKKLRNEVLYNKIILILIIVVEICILAGLLVIKLVKF